MLYAKEVAAPEQTARAISLVYGGFSVAAVLGVPLGTAVCQILGWRWTFAVILAMGAALLPLLLRSLPAVRHRRTAGLLKSFSILWDPRCSLCVGMILCSASATYIVYTYLSPILTETLGLPAGAVSPAAAGDGSVQRRQQSHLRPAGGAGGLRTLPMAFAAQAVLFALLPLLLGNRWAGLAGVFAMGLLMYLLNTPGPDARAVSGRAGLPLRFQPVRLRTAGILQLRHCYRLLHRQRRARRGGDSAPWACPAAMFALAALGLNLLLLRANGRRTAAAAS